MGSRYLLPFTFCSGIKAWNNYIASPVLSQSVRLVWMAATSFVDNPKNGKLWMVQYVSRPLTDSPSLLVFVFLKVELHQPLVITSVLRYQKYLKIAVEVIISADGPRIDVSQRLFPFFLWFPKLFSILNPLITPLIWFRVHYHPTLHLYFCLVSCHIVVSFIANEVLIVRSAYESMFDIKIMNVLSCDLPKFSETCVLLIFKVWRCYGVFTSLRYEWCFVENEIQSRYNNDTLFACWIWCFYLVLRAR